MHELDVNGDGFVAVHEAGDKLDMVFGSVDANRNGFIVATETQTAVAESTGEMEVTVAENNKNDFIDDLSYDDSGILGM